MFLPPQGIIDQRIQIIQQAADKTHAQSNTVMEDTDLILPVTVNRRYACMCTVYVDSSTVADVDYAYSAPAGASGIVTENPTNAGLTAAETISTRRATNGLGAGIISSQVFWCHFKTGATAGDIKFQFAQDTSEATDTIFKEFSTMILWDLGAA